MRRIGLAYGALLLAACVFAAAYEPPDGPKHPRNFGSGWSSGRGMKWTWTSSMTFSYEVEHVMGSPATDDEQIAAFVKTFPVDVWTSYKIFRARVFLSEYAGRLRECFGIDPECPTQGFVGCDHEPCRLLSVFVNSIEE